jgi:hypothetical protein
MWTTSRTVVPQWRAGYSIAETLLRWMVVGIFSAAGLGFGWRVSLIGGICWTVLAAAVAVQMWVSTGAIGAGSLERGARTAYPSRLRDAAVLATVVVLAPASVLVAVRTEIVRRAPGLHVLPEWLVAVVFGALAALGAVIAALLSSNWAKLGRAAFGRIVFGDDALLVDQDGYRQRLRWDAVCEVITEPEKVGAVILRKQIELVPAAAVIELTRPGVTLSPPGWRRSRIRVRLADYGALAEQLRDQLQRQVDDARVH